MKGQGKNSRQVKTFTEQFMFRDSYSFLLDYNGFLLSNRDSGEGKFIKISFNSSPRKARNIFRFQCCYKMMTSCNHSLN